jgi:hypothetical protein
LRILISVIGSLFLFSSTAAAIDVTACGQIVPAGEVGRLVGDLTCPESEIPDFAAVVLERDATFELNGFTLAGELDMGVQCRSRRCTVAGPGTLDGNGIAVLLFPSTALNIHDVTISNADWGILAGNGPGLNGRVVIANVTIEGSLEVALGGKLIRAVGLRVRNTVPTDGLAVLADRLLGSDIEVTNNGSTGILARRIKATNLVATDNGDQGILALERAILVDSTVTGNQADGAGIDIESGRRPKLSNSVCGRSSDRDGVSWGVCAGD